MTYLHRQIATPIPQSEPLDERQVKNNAGGFVYETGPWMHLERFLILGTEGGTYYVDERKHTKQAIRCVDACLKDDWKRTVDLVVAISEAGRAPKNDQALFVLAKASAHADVACRQYALAQLPKVARIGTHLLHFVAYARSFRGWGRALKRAVAQWYARKMFNGVSGQDPQLTYQLLKYQRRDGWSNGDLLRLTHARFGEGADGALWDLQARFALGTIAEKDFAEVPERLTQQLRAGLALQKTTNAQEAARLIRDFRLPRELVPTELLQEGSAGVCDVWQALLDTGGPEMVIRNLATMTRVGLLKPLSKPLEQVQQLLGDAHLLQQKRIHPLKVLAALFTYASGRGARGSATWEPLPQVIDALDAAFYLAFKAVQPTGKRILLSLDVSGSMAMESSRIAGIPGMYARDAAAALALVTAATEPRHGFCAFSSGIVPLDISPKMRLDTVKERISQLPFSRTDCALPMLYAQQQKITVDTFVIITDNETWAGNVHPAEALRGYRRDSGIPAKLIVLGTTATGFTIADPQDPGMLDIVGFDTAVPEVMAAFSTAGE